MKIFRDFYSKADKEMLNEITDLKIISQCLSREVHLKIKDTKQRIWTIEEYQFLKDNWGKLSKKEIAEKLKRSLNTVNVKACRIGLKDYFIYSEEITLNNLHKMIYHRDSDSYTVYVWQSYQMPIKSTKPCKDATYKTIKIADFLSWFEQNKRVINLCLSDEGCFGVDEPDWLKEKRNADKRAAAYGPHNRKWTAEETNTLIKMVNSQKYGYREISIALKRTEGAIKRRMLDIKLEKRPIKAENHNKWKQEEIDKLRDLWLKGYQSCIIAEYINRSALSINGMLERHQYFGDPPRKNQTRSKHGQN